MITGRPIVLLSAVAVTTMVGGVGARQQTPPAWALVREGRLGSGAGVMAELVGPGVITVGPNGNTYVYDALSQRGPTRIIVYDRAGRFVRALGRTGSGPGEFQTVRAMGFLGDTLWTSDATLERVTLFAPDSANTKSAKTLSLVFDPQRPGLSREVARGMLVGGFAVAQGGAIGLPKDATGTVRSSVVRMRRDGVVLDSLATDVTSHAAVRTLIYPNGGRINGIVAARVWQTLPPEDLLWRVIPDGSGVIVVYRTAAVRAPGSYTVRKLDPNGKLVWAHSIVYEPTPITNRIRDSLITWRAAGTDDKTKAELRTWLYIPPNAPPITEMTVGRDGSTWLRREDLKYSGLRWDVMDPSGALVAQVAMPKGLRVMYADMTQVLGVERDADDVPWVVRYRVMRSPAR
jgi:hypothetical protein